MDALNFIGYFHDTENPADVIKHTYPLFTWPTLNRFRNRFRTVLTLARSHGHYRRCGQLRHVVRVDYRLGVN